MAEKQGPSPSVGPCSVAVRRSGGVAGISRTGRLELDSHPDGAEVRRLLGEVDLDALPTPTPTPDRFVYDLDVDDLHLTLAERDLPPPLRRVIQIVLGHRPS